MLLPYLLLVITLAPPASAPSAPPGSRPLPPATRPSSRPSTRLAAATTRPGMSLAQKRFLQAAQNFTAVRIASIQPELKAAKDELNAAKAGTISSSQKDDVLRTTTQLGHIVYHFKTPAARKSLVGELQPKYDVLANENTELKAGHIHAPAVEMTPALKPGDAGTIDDEAYVAEILSPTQYIIEYHGATYQIENTPTKGMEKEKRSKLPKWLAVSGSREYSNRFGNTGPIPILTAVEEFSLDKPPKE